MPLIWSRLVRVLSWLTVSSWNYWLGDRPITNYSVYHWSHAPRKRDKHLLFQVQKKFHFIVRWVPLVIGGHRLVLKHPIMCLLGTFLCYFKDSFYSLKDYSKENNHQNNQSQFLFIFKHIKWVSLTLSSEVPHLPSIMNSKRKVFLEVVTNTSRSTAELLWCLTSSSFPPPLFFLIAVAMATKLID